jgi:GNAT superfamily N-acetyltransferase
MTSLMRVRQADAADAAAIANIHVRGWQAAYRGQVPQAFLDGMDPGRRQRLWDQSLAETSWPRTGTLVAEIDGAVAGFANLAPTRDPDEDPATVAEIIAIYVSPDGWGAGVGKGLMAEALATFRRAGYHQATLWVLEGNTRARRFYEATGWQDDRNAKQETIGGASLTAIRYRLPLG